MITSLLYIKIRSHFSLKRRMSWKFFPVLLINMSFSPQHSHIFFYFSYSCQKSCNLAIVASVLSGYNCICSFIYNAFRPYQIFFTFCFFYWKIRFPPLKIIPEFSYYVPDTHFECLFRTSADSFSLFHHEILYRMRYFLLLLKEMDDYINKVKTI